MLCQSSFFSEQQRDKKKSASLCGDTYPFSLGDRIRFETRVVRTQRKHHPKRRRTKTTITRIKKYATTHRPVARVNQPRRVVRVDFRLLFPSIGIDDIIMVAPLHFDKGLFDDKVWSVCLSRACACFFALSLSLSLSLSLRGYV